MTQEEERYLSYIKSFTMDWNRLMSDYRSLLDRCKMLEERLTELESHDIIEDRYNDKHDEKGRFAPKNGGEVLPVDSNGKPYNRPRLDLSEEEYGKVCGEISTDYYQKYIGEKECFHYTADDTGYHYYVFENHGFGEYNIFKKGDY